MKEHFQDYGVRKWAGDDLIELQSEPLAALQALVEPYAPCIIQGCEVTENGNGSIIVSPGLVALKGKDSKGNACVKIARFAGIESATSIYLTLACEAVNRLYGDGKVKDIAYDYKAVASSQRPEEPFLEISGKEVPRLVDALGITQKLDREGGDASQTKVEFSTTDTEELKSGNPLSKLFGAIKKWLDGLKEKLDGITTKLKGIDDNANNYTHPAHNVITGSTEDMAPAFGATADTYTYNVDSQGHVTGQNTRTIRIPDTVATQSAAGLMSKDDKKKLEDIEANANKTIVESTLNDSSTNPVQNKVVKAALDGKANSSHTHSYLPLAGGSMSGTGGIQYPTTNGTTKTGNFISAGGGYGTGSGKNGLKLLSFDSSDGQAGMGNDLTGYTYETTLAAAQDTSGNTHITFAKHAANSKTYTRLAEIDGSGNFNAKGQIKENGTRVYSPNNKPTPGDIGAAASSHTHDYLPLAGGTITGNLRLKGSGNFGNKLNFGDGEYVYLHEATNDKLTIYSKSGIDFSAYGTLMPFNVKGLLQENGSRVYSPNNKPTIGEIGAAASGHTHSYNDLTNKPTIPTVDTALNTTSQNPVQNNVIKAALDGKVDKLSPDCAVYYFPLDGTYGVNDIKKRTTLSGDISNIPWKNGGREFNGNVGLFFKDLPLNQWASKIRRFTIVVDALKYPSSSTYPNLFDCNHALSGGKGFNFQKENNTWHFGLSGLNTGVSIPDSDLPKNVWLRYYCWIDSIANKMGMRIVNMETGATVTDQETSMPANQSSPTTDITLKIGSCTYWGDQRYWGGLIRNVGIYANYGVDSISIQDASYAALPGIPKVLLRGNTDNNNFTISSGNGNGRHPSTGNYSITYLGGSLDISKCILVITPYNSTQLVAAIGIPTATLSGRTTYNVQIATKDGTLKDGAFSFMLLYFE